MNCGNMSRLRKWWRMSNQSSEHVTFEKGMEGVK